MRPTKTQENSQSRVTHAVLARLDGPLDEAVHEVLELRPRDLDVHVLGARGVGGDEGERHVRLRHAVQFALRLNHES